MKCSFGKDNWQGTQPISCLTEYCISLFYSLSEEIDILTILLSLSRKVEEIEIVIINPETAVNNPAYIDGLRKKIFIEETFLSFLWTSIYSTIVDFDEYIQKRALGREEDKTAQEMSKNVLSYGKSLLNRYSTWNIDELANPASHVKSNENYVNLTTMYFQYAFMFVILHELSHGLKGHDVPFQSKSNSQFIQDEFDVDLLAFKLLLKSTHFEEDYKFKRDGAIMGLCSLLLISAGKNSSTHPETADRVKALIDYVNPGVEEWIWGISGMTFQNWLMNNMDPDTKIPTRFADYIQYFNFMLDLMKKPN